MDADPMDLTNHSSGSADFILRPSHSLIDNHLNQSSSVWTDEDRVGEVPTSETGTRTTIFVFYFLTCMLGILGNGLVVYVILRHPEIRAKSVANRYILNLAIADLCLTSTLVFFCYATLTGHWAFGWFFCKVAYAVRECNKYVSIFTLVALAFDRYLASFYSAARFRTALVGKLVCAGIWCCFVVMTTPYWIYCGVAPIHGGRDSCRILTRSEDRVTLMKAKYLVEFVPGFLVPLLLIVIAYSALGVRLHRVLNAGAKTAVKRPGRVMTRMTLVITLTFLVAQLPYHVVSMLNVAKMEEIRAEQMTRSSGNGLIAPSGNSSASIGHPTSIVDRAEAQRYISLNAVATILVFLGSCCNPIIYGFLNHNYRNLYAGVFCGCCRGPEAGDRVAGSSDSACASRESRNRSKASAGLAVVTQTEAIELA